MATLWFSLLAAMLVVYVVLDGFDLGAGALHLFVARTDDERKRVLRAIGPFWDGNEVWLLAAGGTMVFAFPRLYAQSFSGFFLPLMVVLWLLMGRGIAIEFRGHLENDVWKTFWDTIFAVSSALLCVFFGAALGNVVRGVPLEGGTFFEPFFTDFRPTGYTGILDWYTTLVGLFALSALSLHGARWLVLKTDGALAERARRAGTVLFAVSLVLVAAISIVTFRVQPWIGERLKAQPLGLAFPVAGFAAFFASASLARKGRDAAAFAASSLFLAGLLAATAFGLFPQLLPSSLAGGEGLTIHNAAAPASGLRTALFWWIPGMALVSVYTVFVYRHFKGKS